MPHSAAVPWRIRKPLCLTGPPPLCPPGVCIPPMTVGIRHAPSIQVMYPPVGAMSTWAPRGALQVALSSNQGSALYGTLHLRHELKGIAGDVNVGLKQIILLVLSYGLPSTDLNRNANAPVKSVTNHRGCVAVSSRHAAVVDVATSHPIQQSPSEACEFNLS